jgi:hypothetical protein
LLMKMLHIEDRRRYEIVYVNVTSKRGSRDVANCLCNVTYRRQAEISNCLCKCYIEDRRRYEIVYVNVTSKRGRDVIVYVNVTSKRGRDM